MTRFSDAKLPLEDRSSTRKTSRRRDIPYVSPFLGVISKDNPAAVIRIAAAAILILSSRSQSRRRKMSIVSGGQREHHLEHGVEQIEPVKFHVFHHTPLITGSVTVGPGSALRAYRCPISLAEQSEVPINLLANIILPALPKNPYRKFMK